MRHVLFILNNPEQDAAAGQRRALISGLRERGWTVTAAVLCGNAAAVPGEWSAPPVDLHGHSPDDPLALVRLWRHCRRERPGVIHLWETPGPLLRRLSPYLGAKVVCDSSAGPPLFAAVPLPMRQVEEAAVRAAVGLPPSARFVLCAPPLTTAARCAVWAMNILNCVHDNLHLIVTGDGPERARLEQFTSSIRASDHVRFVGRPWPAAALLAAADILWLPTCTNRVPDIAMQALALGRPVVAAAHSTTSSTLIRDGEMGLTAAPDDPPAWARQTQRLLAGVGLAERLGAAGPTHARRFSREAMVEACEKWYGAAFAQRRRAA